MSNGNNFDYYVLSQTYTPLFCRGVGASKPWQCTNFGDKSPIVLHGLWPQRNTEEKWQCTTTNIDHHKANIQVQRVPCQYANYPENCGNNTQQRFSLDPTTTTFKIGDKSMFPTVNRNNNGINWDSDLTEEQEWWKKYAPGYKGTLTDPNLVFHEWDGHGRCSGLEPQDYFKAAKELAMLTQPYNKLKKIYGRIYF